MSPGEMRCHSTLICTPLNAGVFNVCPVKLEVFDQKRRFGMSHGKKLHDLIEVIMKNIK